MFWSCLNITSVCKSCWFLSQMYRAYKCFFCHNYAIYTRKAHNLSSLMSSIFQFFKIWIFLIITYTINFKIHILFFLFHRRWNPQEGLYRPFGRIDSSRFWGWRWFLCLHALLGQIVRQVNSKSNQKTCWLFQWRK